MKIKHIIRLTAAILAVCCAAGAGGCSRYDHNENSTDIYDISSSPTSEVSQQSEKSEEESEILEEEESIPAVNDPTPDNEGETVNGIFVYNNVAYELFYGSEGMAEYYAHTISDIKSALGDDIKVYNVVVPTHVGVDLPDKFEDLCSSQEDYLNKIVSSYTSDVIGVNAYSKLMHHRNEYLYFNSDHHWTALAAYYAYTEFTKAAGIDPVELDNLDKDVIEDFTGSLAYDTGLDDLKTDYVEYYTPKNDIDCTKYDSYGEDPEDFMLIHSYAGGVNSYGVFLGGDNPLLVAKNENGNGKKIAVVKESYGNAFAPFIAYTYSETHIIDFRYFDLDLKSYLEENGIDEIIFINNSMASATDTRCEELAGLIKQ